MKKKLVSISLAAALLLSSLSTAGMSVFASEADESTTTTTAVTVAAEVNTTASTTAAQSVSSTSNYKDAIGQFVSKFFSTATTTAAPTTSTTTTTTAASETETTSSTTAASGTETTSSTTAASGTETTSSTSASETTTTTVAESVPATPLTPAKPDYQAIAKKVISKIFSKKYSQVTVAQKNVTLLKNHYSLVRATGKGYISYFSLNKNVATVDKYGIIKAVNEGQTRIRVIAWGNSEYYPSTTYVNVNVKSSWLDVWAPLFK